MLRESWAELCHTQTFLFCWVVQNSIFLASLSNATLRWTRNNVPPPKKNYETYYRSARLRVLTSFEQFYLCWTIFFIYLSLSWSVSIYLDLIWFSSAYLDLFQFIIVYLWLSLIILVLFVQILIFWTISYISSYLRLSLAISGILAYLHTCLLA